MAKFKLGNVYETSGVHSLREENEEFNIFVNESFARHCNGDWGDLCDEDWNANDFALRNGDDRLVSKYVFNNEVSIYIITEWDRSATTILFPEEY